MADAEGGDDTSIKLADFGYAVQVWPDEPGLRSQCGTPCYIAPEILRRERYGKVRCMVLGVRWCACVLWYLCRPTHVQLDRRQTKPYANKPKPIPLP